METYSIFRKRLDRSLKTVTWDVWGNRMVSPIRKTIVICGYENGNEKWSRRSQKSWKTFGPSSEDDSGIGCRE